jgi:uncharacterized protein (TIGR03437 family)
LLWSGLLAIAFGLSAFAGNQRYALILEDAPAAHQFENRTTLRSAAADSYRAGLRAKHDVLRLAIRNRGANGVSRGVSPTANPNQPTANVDSNIAITGESDTLLNAVFVSAPESARSDLAGLPGVKAVVPLHAYKLELNRATALVNAQAAWANLGGVSNAGAGVKIAILDTGIDQTHPMFQDSTLRPPTGFPICSGADCAFTNNKVIVARSYVQMLAAPSSAANPSADSRPDDISPRDRIGHGTALAGVAAGVPVGPSQGAAVAMNGMAPKAFLGNYKIFGSPQVNDFTYDDVIIKAVEDALKDGMDIASLSIGSPALAGALDQGAACGQPAGIYCEPAAAAIDNAVKSGMVVVIAAGNLGDSGLLTPTLGTIGSPGISPSAITVGAVTNSHRFTAAVRVSGTDTPASLQVLSGQSGDNTASFTSATGPMVDVNTVGGGLTGCVPLPDGILKGLIVIIRRGECTFFTKASYAQAAGAVGVILYMADSSSPIVPGGLSGTNLPVIMISADDGTGLTAYLENNPLRIGTIDPSGTEISTTGNLLKTFSARGPSIGTNALKPDLVAVGAGVYMPAQNYDPLGLMYSPSRFTVADGTSFSTPMVAGAAALVKQAHPSFTPAQIKSVLVNSATQDLAAESGSLNVMGIGGGKLNAGAAVAATVVADPVSISFGAWKGDSASIGVKLTNTGAAVALSLGLDLGNSPSSVTLALDKPTLNIPTGATGTFTLTLSGPVPAAAIYGGAVTVTGQNVAMRIPFAYVVGTGVPANLIPLSGSGFSATVGESYPLSVRLVDSSGLAVAGAPVVFRASRLGTVRDTTTTTNQYGIATTQATGSQPGSSTYIANGGGFSTSVSGFARRPPAISPGGIISAGIADLSGPVAPGSYISIYGSNLSDTGQLAPDSSRLPLAINYTIVSFDVPSAGISVPGHLTYAGPGQVNVQVPWELQGQSSALVKVTLDYSFGAVYTLALADYVPALFGGTRAAALDASNRGIDDNNPVPRGQVVQLFANGLGPVTNPPASGDPASGTTLSETTRRPVVTIGGQPAEILFSGLAPGFPGLYQINARIPSGIATGVADVTVSIGGKTSKSAGLPVK